MFQGPKGDVGGPGKPGSPGSPGEKGEDGVPGEPGVGYPGSDVSCHPLYPSLVCFEFLAPFMWLWHKDFSTLWLLMYNNYFQQNVGTDVDRWTITEAFVLRPRWKLQLLFENWHNTACFTLRLLFAWCFDLCAGPARASRTQGRSGECSFVYPLMMSSVLKELSGPTAKLRALVYSKTCPKQPSLGANKSGLSRRVVSIWRLHTLMIPKRLQYTMEGEGPGGGGGGDA